ncbi:glycosyltransferase family 2 protein [Candidatus Allofournierella merdipullorum]|uniref:glycosyltransferase family 2 protein n=1 Tax=Candidatus Allofournierella merdipullorum TaxID=2838595 RepID=UPI003AB23395
MAPKVTIVIPVYKVEQYLPACIESVRAQTFTDWECILVDDGSPDGCGAICDEAARQDERFRVVHRENGGLSRARNSGMEVARGEYYVFLDSDDAIHPRLLELVLKEQAHRPNSLITWTFTENQSDWANLVIPDVIPATVYGQRDLLRYFANRTLFNSATNKLYPRETILQHNLWFDPSAGYVEDYVFFTAFWKVLFASSSDKNICQLNLPLYYYNRSNTDSITHTTGASYTRDFSSYCTQQLELYAQARDIFGSFENYPPKDVLTVSNAALNSIAYGLCNLPHPHREIVALWRVPELTDILRWHRRYHVHNVYLLFLQLRWAGGVKWWFRMHEMRPDLYSLVYCLGYRKILRS